MEAILIALRALDAKDEALAAVEAEKAEKRAKDAARKRADRDAARNVHGQSTDAARTNSDPSLSRPPNENNSNPPTHTHPETNPRARKGTRLSDDWQPEPLTGKALAMTNAWPSGQIERELAKFRNFWASKAGKDACKLDWQKTWANWLINADERIPRNDRQSHPERRIGLVGSSSDLGKTGAAFAALRSILDPGEGSGSAESVGQMRNVTPRANLG
jgi:hypothetical protein